MELSENDLAKERSPGSNEGQSLDKFLTAMDAMSRKLDAAFERMDVLEAHHKKDAKKDDASKKRDDESEEEYEKRMREGRSAGEAREVVADSAHRGEFADAQERAEKAYLSWGMRANAPLAGERLRDYRIRLLRGMQKHSKQYSRSVWKRSGTRQFLMRWKAPYTRTAFAASSAPDSVEPGRLRMVTKRLASGHTVNEFIGSPNAWMDKFAGARRYVTNIDPKHKQ